MHAHQVFKVEVHVHMCRFSSQFLDNEPAKLSRREGFQPVDVITKFAKLQSPFANNAKAYWSLTEKGA